MKIARKLTDESDRDHAKREFNICMDQVGRCEMLQSIRRNEQYYGAAKFYQFEAARWYERALDCRVRYSAIMQIEAVELIPGTRVKWADLFVIAPLYIQQFGRGNRTVGPGRICYVDEWEDVYANLIPLPPTYCWNDPGIREHALMLMRPTSRANTLIMAQQALKLAASSAYGKIKTPTQKFNNPRDVPMTLSEQMEQLLGRDDKRK